MVVSYRPGEVKLEAASPVPGFTADVEDSGPPKVRVEFESQENNVDVRAEWRDGNLLIEIIGPDNGED